MKTSNRLLLGALVLILIFIGTMITIVKIDYDKGTGNIIKGNGVVVSQVRETPLFREVEVTGPISLELTQGSTCLLKLETDENLIDLISTEVKNEKLKISLSKKINNLETTKVNLSAPVLQSVALYSGAKLIARDTITSDDLSISVSSRSRADLLVHATNLRLNGSAGGKIILQGNSDNLKISSNSGGYIDASKLKTENCQVVSSSGATSKIWVTGECSIKVNSGARVKYTGSPVMQDLDISSGGSVSRDD